ncbi:MAG: UDP-3-O-[Alphaproteobacteria bacterium]|nr:UDP-3-O-[3-hydroxymyristoyl] N-acetylglucosamine deacetylase [Alphaproteobacteria bacterium]
MKQCTFENKIEIKGPGLHSGLDSVLILREAPVDTGIVFVQSGVEIKALYNEVKDTKNCTCLQKNGRTVSTIEHLMATLWAKGVDNAYIDVSNPELPIMDGSALMLFEELKKAKLKPQDKERKILKVLKTVRFEDDKGNFVELCPPKDEGLHIYFKIEFPSEIVGTQVFDETVNEDVFEKKIAPARTFCEKYQIDYLRSIGLIKGGSLENAVVLDGNKVLNPEGFRVQNECVNHKVLDLIGDLFTSGYYIFSDVKALKTGHFHNNEVLKKLFDNKENYEIL